MRSADSGSGSIRDRISDHVAIFSRTASFAFDRAWSEATISSARMASPRYPMLRLARVVDPFSEAAEDPALVRLMSWASTVIRVSLKSGRRGLADDLAGFPAAFLLFSPDTSEMHLEDVKRISTALSAEVTRMAMS